MNIHSGTIKAVIELHNQGNSVVKIAKILNLRIEEVIDVINEHS